MENNGNEPRVGDVAGVIDPLDLRSEARRWLATLLRREGTDLMSMSESELERGTPVYVETDADVVRVQRLMARNHIRRVPVLNDGVVLGMVDLVRLAMLGDE